MATKLKLFSLRSFPVCILLFVLGGLVFQPQQAEAQTSEWLEPVEMTQNNQVGTFPNITTDQAGNVHIFWSTSIGVYDVVMYQRLSANGAWSEQNDIQAINNGSSRIIPRPFVTVDKSGTMWMLLRNFTMYLSSVPDADALNGASWSDRSPVSSEDNVAYFGTMQISEDQTFHLIYTENDPNTPCTSCFGLYYRRSEDQGLNWTDPIRINSEAFGAAKPQLLEDPDGILHLVWESGIGGDLGSTESDSQIMYSQSNDQGATWTEPLTLNSDSDEYGKNPSLGRTEDGNLVIAWLSLDLNVLDYSISINHGKTWSTPSAIPDIRGSYKDYPARTDGSSMATDSNGNVHYVTIGEIPGQSDQLSVIDLTWNGETWSAPDVIYTYSGDVPEWPRIAISKGNQLNVVWFVRDEKHIWDSDNGLYTVWFSNKVIDALETVINTESFPTSTPKQTATVLVDETITMVEYSTPTPIPTETPISFSTTTPLQTGPLGLGKPIYDEMGYIGMLGTTIIPSTVVVIVVILVVAFLRRRE